MPNINVDSVLKIPFTGNFFRVWLEFLKPIHHLRNSEMDVAAALLELRHELSSKIEDEKILDKEILSTKSREYIMKKTGTSKLYFQSVLKNIKNCGMIKDGRVNLKYVPNIDDKDTFKLLIVFNIKNNHE